MAALKLKKLLAEAGGAASSVDLGASAVAVAAGDLIQLSVSAAPTDGTGLTASLVIEPDLNALTVE